MRPLPLLLAAVLVAAAAPVALAAHGCGDVPARPADAAASSAGPGARAALSLGMLVAERVVLRVSGGDAHNRDPVALVAVLRDFAVPQGQSTTVSPAVTGEASATTCLVFLPKTGRTLSDFRVDAGRAATGLALEAWALE